MQPLLGPLCFWWVRGGAQESAFLQFQGDTDAAPVGTTQDRYSTAWSPNSRSSSSGRTFTGGDSWACDMPQGSHDVCLLPLRGVKIVLWAREVTA